MKILLLTDVPPTTKYTGGLVLKQLLRFLPRGSIACFTVFSEGVDVTPDPEFDWMPIAYTLKPREFTMASPNRFIQFARSYIRDRKNSWVSLNPIAQKAAVFGCGFGADAVWCTLQGPSMIRLAKRVSERMNVPLLAFIADPPDWWLAANNFDHISSAKIMREYEDVIRYSARCGVASWNMAEEYKRLYGTECIPVVPSLAKELSFPPSNSFLRSDDQLIIGMAGQIYAQAEWLAFLRALDSINWSIEGRSIKIRVLAHADVIPLFRDNPHIEFLGWYPQDQALQLLSENDLNYCPYRFGKDRETEARLCFPGKLTSYLAAGRPVLFHGPDYSSPAQFLRDHSALTAAHSLNPQDIIRALAEIIKNPEHYTNLAANGYNAYLQNLTLESYRSYFSAFLGVEETWLNAV